MKDLIDQIVFDYALPILLCVALVMIVSILPMAIYKWQTGGQDCHSTLECVTLDDGTSLCRSTEEVLDEEARSNTTNSVRS